VRGPRAFPYLLLAPALLTLTATTLVPVCCTFLFSLQDVDLDLSGAGWGGRFNGGSNYAEALRDPQFIGALRNTLVFVAAAVPLEILLGFAMALLLDWEFRMASLVRSLLLLPVVVSPVVAAVTWRMLLNTDVGLLNYALGFLGVGPRSWLGDPRLAMPALILSDVWQWSPYCMLLLLAGLQSLPAEVHEAARVDGAGFLQMTVRVTLPLLRPVLVVVLIFRGLEAFIIFDKVYILTGGGPGFATETLSLYVYRTGLKYFHLGVASAMAFVMFAVALGASLPLVRAVSRRVS
jgi:multiple sugar transport system permease protein